MKEINLITLLFCCIFFFGCNNNKAPFTISAWNKKDDMLYTDRVKVVDDLIKNHLNEKMCFKEIIDLLGSQVAIARRSLPNYIFFEVETRYGSDIDPKWIKVLEIELNEDSCFHKARVIKLD